MLEVQFFQTHLDLEFKPGNISDVLVLSHHILGRGQISGQTGMKLECLYDWWLRQWSVSSDSLDLTWNGHPIYDNFQQVKKIHTVCNPNWCADLIGEGGTHVWEWRIVYLRHLQTKGLSVTHHTKKIECHLVTESKTWVFFFWFFFGDKAVNIGSFR